jgi:hypothetical protein
MSYEFADVISNEEQLRKIVGFPAERNVRKVISILDEHCRDFIALSPFLLLATSDLKGNMDISPKGDPPGFVQILDEQTLAIPDRPGNRRSDSFTNILQNPKVGLLFMIPGKRETLRVSGSAQIVRDVWLREQMAVNGKVPSLALVIKLEAAFIHCAKCVIRSHLWDVDQWPDSTDLSSIARVIIDHANLDIDLDEYQQAVDVNLRSELY